MISEDPENTVLLTTALTVPDCPAHEAEVEAEAHKVV